MVTPSLVMVGAPNFLSMTTLRPRGPIVTLTASARALTPRSRARRASSSNSRIFAMRILLFTRFRPGQPRRRRRRPGRMQHDSCLLRGDRVYVAVREDEVLLVVVLDLGAAVLAVEHDVADLDVDRHALALVVDAAGADGDDGALLGLLL